MKNPCPHGMDFSSIFNDFGVFFLPGGTPGGGSDLGGLLEAPGFDFYRTWTLLGTPLGAQVGSKFGALGRPEAS